MWLLYGLTAKTSVRRLVTAAWGLITPPYWPPTLLIHSRVGLGLVPSIGWVGSENYSFFVGWVEIRLVRLSDASGWHERLQFYCHGL